MDSDGQTTINYNETITTNGNTTNKHWSWTGGDVEFHSTTEIDVDYDEDTYSTKFSYTVIRDDDCVSNDDSNLTITHLGKSNKIHRIFLRNFTCFENSSNPMVVIDPNDGDISCKAVNIPRGSRIDCSYGSDLSTQPGFLNITLQGNDSVTTFNRTELRQLISSFFNIPIQRVNVTVIPMNNNILVLRIDIGPGPSLGPRANDILRDMTIQKLVEAKVIKSGTNTVKPIFITPVFDNSSSKSNFPYLYFLNGLIALSTLSLLF